MNPRSIIAGSIVAATALVGCGMQPPKPTPGQHILSEEQPRTDGDIPPAVQFAPVLPRPKPVAKPETYSVVVSNVRVQELLFALARDAKLNIDVHPAVSGTVTLNAIDQTLPQLLSRISRQVDMRYEIDGANLIVMRDTPYLQNYRIDYVNIARNTQSQVSLSTQVAGGAAGGTGTNSTSTIASTSNNRFWETLVNNVRDLLRETDRVLPTGTAQAHALAQASAAASAAPPAGGAVQPAATPAAAPGVQPGTTFREAASVIPNPEAGVLSIRATSRQHERIQAFLDQVMASAKRQVMIEATIVEVLLNNNYQRGIDWSRLRGAGATAGFQFQQQSGNTPAAVSTNAFVAGYALGSFNFSAAMRMLESFGDVKVLSSPKMTVLNNHMATLRVADNIVYFEVTANTVATATGPATTTFSTSARTVPVGFLMSVVPQISETDTVLLNLRPTISRLVRFVSDPNPSLGNVPNLVPETQTREMESLLRVQSGQTAVLGGLIQDDVRNTEDGIPGINRVPGLGELLRQRQDTVRKTELVIFLRPTVIREPSLDGDFSRFRDTLPNANFLRRPNPAKAEAYGEPAAQ